MSTISLTFHLASFYGIRVDVARNGKKQLNTELVVVKIRFSAGIILIAPLRALQVYTRVLMPNIISLLFSQKIWLIVLDTVTANPGAAIDAIIVH